MATQLEHFVPPRLDVCVSQNEIDTAVIANSGHCMVADAVKRCFRKRFKRGAFGVSVDLQTIRFTDREKQIRYVYLTPVVGQRALLQFDQGIKPTPFSFRITKNGAQAIPSLSRERPTNKRSEAQEAQLRKTTKRSNESRQKRAEIVTEAHRGNSRQHTKVGGKAPPVAVLSGNRRQFGIRAAGLLDAPTQ